MHITTVTYSHNQSFRKCAFICAHYGMCAEFDSLIISLCKFTNLQNNPDVCIVFKYFINISYLETFCKKKCLKV